MTRNSQLALFSGAALAALALIPAPLRAQEGELSRAQVQSNLRLLRILEDGLSRAEQSRLKGDCTSVRITAEVFLDRLHGRQIIYRNRSDPLPDLPPDAKADMERRINEILARDCPPRSGTSALSTGSEGANQTGAIPPQSAPFSAEVAPSATQPLPQAPAPVGSQSRSDPPYDTSQSTTQPPPPPDKSIGAWHVFIDILFGAGQTDVPQTGIGFMRDGPSGSAPEEFAGTTPDRLNFVSLEAFANFSAGRTPMRVGVSYSGGDASNFFNIQGNSGIDSGVVYGDDAPSGSSGIATPFGLTGGTEVEHRNYGGVFDLGIYGGGAWNSSWFEEAKLPGPATHAGFSAYVAYDHFDRDYRGFADYSGDGGGFIFEFSQDRAQELSEDHYGAGLTGRVVTSFGGGVFGHLTGSAGGYYRDSEFESVERNLCNFCPLSDRDFTIAIDDSDGGWGFKGQAGAMLELRVAPNVSLVAGASADYWSSVGGIFNPNSGDQVFFDGLNTAIRTEDSWSWQAGGGFIVRFGGR